MVDINNKFVFLSYASENLDQVWEVYNGLKRRGLNLWFDKVDLKSGKWYTQVMKAIAQSKYFVICISQAALKKTGDTPGFQDNELNRAFEIAMAQPDTNFSIVPVRLEDCYRGDNRLNIWQQYDLFTNFESALDHLALNLGGHSLSNTQATDERNEDEKMLDRLYDKAITIHYSGDYKQAIAIYNTILSFNPNHIDALLNKAISFSLLDIPESANEALDKIFEIKSDHHVAWFIKGFMFFTSERNEESILAFDKAISIKPDYFNAWRLKGAALSNLGRYKEAVKALDRALEIKPDSNSARFIRGYAREKGNISKISYGKDRWW